jgi:pectate lyase
MNSRQTGVQLALVTLTAMALGCGDSGALGPSNGGGSNAGGGEHAEGGSTGTSNQGASNPGGGQSGGNGEGAGNQGGAGPGSPFEGFGADTPGGEGMPVFHVTNLDESGPGSLADAVSEDGRYIVFDIGGTIQTGGGNIYVSGRSFLTIDGASAPAPGITVDGGGFIVEDSHDIVISHLRARNAGDDGMRAYASHDVVFDHCSSANNSDGSLDVTSDSYNVTVQWCLLGPAGSGVMLISYDTRDVSVHHNLFSSQQPSGVGERNPLLHAAPATSAVDYLMADFRNNLVWGWGRDAGDSYGYGSGVDHGATANIVNNFYQTSGSQQGNAIELNHESSGAAAYASGNVSGNGVDLSSVGNLDTAFDAAPITTDSACVAATKVLAQAGAQPLDAIDQAFVAQISLANCR